MIKLFHLLCYIVIVFFVFTFCKVKMEMCKCACDINYTSKYNKFFKYLISQELYKIFVYLNAYALLNVCNGKKETEIERDNEQVLNECIYSAFFFPVKTSQTKFLTASYFEITSDKYAR